MASTPQFPHRLIGRLLTLLVLVTVFGSACSANPSWIPVESTQPADDAPAGADAAPEELAFVDDQADDTVNSAIETVNQASEPPAPSADFCSASANVWIHSAALNLLGTDASAEMIRIAMANVAEWIERSTLFADPAGPNHRDMFDAFTELQTTIRTDFDYDWTAMQASSSYANSDAAQRYEAARADLVPFLNEHCESLSMSDLRAEAKARADELIVEFSTNPSTVVESDSLPGHSIFTHASGRLIASFPTAWSYEEQSISANGPVLVDLVASPDIERFFASDAIDGVHLQLVEAATIQDFRTWLDQTRTASTCVRSNDLSDTGTVRVNITQTFDCIAHGASIIGQYNESRGLGLIIEASFDRPEASRADLIRLASIANSALWS